MFVLPKPKRVIGHRKYWDQAEIYSSAGLPLPDGPNRLINSANVKEVFGGVSDMWIWRHSAERKTPSSDEAA